MSICISTRRSHKITFRERSFLHALEFKGRIDRAEEHRMIPADHSQKVGLAETN